MNTDLSPALPQKTDNSPGLAKNWGVPRIPARIFADAVAYLGKKDNRPYKPLKSGWRNGERAELPTSPRATRVVKTENGVGIKYHDTIVVEYLPEGIRLNTDGFRTMTTKERINDALGAIETGLNSFGGEFMGHWRVSQDHGVWYISNNGANPATLVFFDGVTIGYDGIIVNPPSPEEISTEIQRVTRLTRQINEYAKAATNALLNGEIDVPSGGDCWYCVLRNSEGIPLGDLGSNSDHLLQHLEENYFVPSLIMNSAAAESQPRYLAGSVYNLMENQGALTGDFFDRLVERDLPRAIRRYLKSRLGIAGAR